MQIELGSLLSRTKRKAFSKDGIKTIVAGFTAAVEQKQDQDADGNIITRAIGWIWGAATKALGWLVSHLWDWVKSVVSWSFTSIVQWVQQTFQFIWTFDWNQSDAEIDNQIEQNYNALLTQAGGTLGSALGWLVCGLAPGAVMFVFNEALGVYVLNHVGQEAIEEVLPQISSLLRSTARTVTRHAIMATYKRLRERMIGTSEVRSLSDDEIVKRWTDQLSTEEGDGGLTLKQVQEGIEKTKRVRDAAQEGFQRKPWSFQKKFEEWKDANIPKRLRDAADEAIEEFSDSCLEAMYCVAGGLDAYVAMQRMTRSAILGNQTGVRIVFNRQLPSSTNPDPNPNPSPSPTPSPSP